MFWKKKPLKSAGDDPATAQPQDDLLIAQRALEQDGDPAHAVSHLAWALARDPQDRRALALLERAIRAARDPLALAPISTTEPTPYPIIAVRALLLRRQGQLDEALHLMAQIYQVVPDAPFLAWVTEWAADEEGFEATDPGVMALLIGSLSTQLSQGLGQGSADALTALTPALLRYQATHPQPGAVGALLSTLVRKQGQLDEAMALAWSAYAAEPGYMTAAILGGAHRALGATAEAVAAYRAALGFEPDDLPIRLDLGDILCENGQFIEGLAAYGEVLAREPQHSWALPSTLYYRAVLEPHGGWEEQLEHYAQANPDNGRAQYLAGQLAPYHSWLPCPRDAIVNAIETALRDNHELVSGDITVSLSALESPSARLAVERALARHSPDARLVVSVEQLQRPDPRLPSGPTDVVLWRYQGNDPQPALGPPFAEVANAVAELAARPFHADSWFAQAGQIAVRLGEIAPRDLLATMVHPPEPPADVPVWDWIFRVQVAAAFVLAALDKGWDGSLRRRALFALARGPLDWSVAAAVIALVHLARREPAARAEIGTLYSELLGSMPRPGFGPYRHALLCCVFLLPEAPQALLRRAHALIEAEREPNIVPPTGCQPKGMVREGKAFPKNQLFPVSFVARCAT
ncbi:MAG TPA: tetratricopeptide repeat protein [Roseiflexaceae bacterium]|nr:tetratricopeptide repeat protein [Roseiflexaceae bacterium]